MAAKIPPTKAKAKLKEISSKRRCLSVEFNPTRGHEIRKTRPALIIQNDIGAGTAQSPSWPLSRQQSSHILSSFPSLRPKAMVFPLHPGFTSVKSGRFDRERLVKRLGAVDGATMRQVDETLKVSLGLAGF